MRISDWSSDVCSSDLVLAERALVAGYRRRHAQARVGVDVGRADIALHQLVGDVIVFRQQLSRNVERDAVRAVCGNGLRKARGNLRQRIVPTRTLPELRTTLGVAALRMEQACLRTQGLDRQSTRLNSN